MILAATLTDLILKGSAELGKDLIEEYAKRAVGENGAKIKELKSNITPHIDATFAKCSTIKTLLNPLSPANFLSIYATQRFSLNDLGYDHYGMVDYIKKKATNLILTGSGGSGKSMFTKYLWLSLFVESEGKIPLFVELRNLNSVTVDSIIAYLQQLISIGQGLITTKDFQKYLSRGDFVIILDGFDEVIQDKKESIQTQIITISENFRDLKIIVTSRPDGRFSSWPSFEVAQLAPLHKEDVIELITKAEFSDDFKKAFLKRIKTTDLFQKHNSFLTNPLLASMMLLTFSYNFDIPDRMHLFYQQAFDVLYQRHDSYKSGGFTREFKTKLSEDVFKRIISYFCLVTYYGEEFIFSREGAILSLKKAIELFGARADASDMLDDLNLCVCFLIQEGLQYVFSHRSFQEYFAAYCMAIVVPDRIEQLVPKFLRRTNDQVVLLLADMSPEIFRRNYVVPTAKKFEAKLQLGQAKKSIIAFYNDLGVTFRMEMSPLRSKMNRSPHTKKIERDHFIFLEGGNDFTIFVRLIEKLIVRELPNQRILSGEAEKDKKAVHQIFDLLGVAETNSITVVIREGQFAFEVEPRKYFPDVAKKPNQQKVQTRVDPDEKETKLQLTKMFRASYMFEYLRKMMDSVEKYLLDQLALEANSNDAMDNLFGQG